MSTPKYRLIEKYLREKISSKEYKPGDLIPSECELAEMFDVSRMTARKAVEHLVASDKVYRVKGKGSIVSEKKLIKNKSLVGFRNSLLLENNGTSELATKVLSFTKIFPSIQIQKALKLNKTDRVFEIKRLRLLNGEAIGIESAYLSCSRYKGLDEYDLAENSLYDILKLHFNTQPSLTNQTVSAKFQEDNHITKYLFSTGEGITLELIFVTYDQNHEAFEYTVCSYSADKFNLKQNIVSDRHYEIEGE